MSLATRFTELVGCSVPIQQAGMGEGSPPELAAAVSSAGAFGMVGTARPGGKSPDLVRGLVERTRAATAQPFGVNFIIRKDEPLPIPQECFEIAASSARAVEFFLWDAPDTALFDLIHCAGALVMCQVGSAALAAAAVDAGCDVIVAQSISAGGHVLGTIGLLPLLDEVLETVDVPVLAAGGISSGRGLAAVLAAGADGARVGTRFIGAAEAQVHPAYVGALLDATAHDTEYGETFSATWPNAPHRALRSSIEAANAFDGEVVGEGTSLDGTRVPIRLFSGGVPSQSTTGTIGAMPLWAGESVGGLKDVQPAADIVHELVRDAEALLQRYS